MSAIDYAAMHSADAEMSVLGALLLVPDSIDRVGDLTESDFFIAAHRAIFRRIASMHANRLGVDVVTVAGALQEFGELESVGGIGFIAELAANVAGAANVQRYAEMVVEKRMMRDLAATAGEIVEIATAANGFSAMDRIDQAQSKMLELSKVKDSQSGPIEVGALLPAFLEELERRSDMGGELTGLETGFQDLDDRTKGLQPGSLIIIAGRPSMGKAQPLDAKVKTVSGWVAMGDIAVGDRLASVDGQESVVSGVYPQGEREVFKVVFSDGRSAECCKEHLWRVMYRDWDEPKLLSTGRIMEMLKRARYKNRLWIDYVSGDFGCDDALPVHPWVLGAMLGDGTFSESNNCGRFSTKSPELVSRMNELSASLGVELVFVAGYDWRIVGRGRDNGKGTRAFEPNGLRAAIKELGLFGTLSETKFIPEKYLRASKESRIALLQGLLDTDGWIEKWGSIRFSSASKQLSDDVTTLVRSLGGFCSMSEKKTSYSYKGEKKAGKVAYSLCISFGNGLVPFTLSEKIGRIRAVGGAIRRATFSSIASSRIAESQCIMVSHPSHTYITNDYVVTHNTTFALNIAERAALNGKTALVFSMEMPKQQLLEKCFASIGGVDLDVLGRGKLSEEEFSRVTAAMARLDRSGLVIDDSSALSVSQMSGRARRVKRKRGQLDLIVIDYLQLIGSSKGKASNRNEEVGEITRGLKLMARDLGVPVIALSQLSRKVEDRTDKRPMMSDLRESGAIEQDADLILMAYRDDYYRPDSPYKGLAEILVRKHRMGSVGDIKLVFQGQYSRFLDADSQAIASACQAAAEAKPKQKSRGFND